MAALAIAGQRDGEWPTSRLYAVFPERLTRDVGEMLAFPSDERGPPRGMLRQILDDDVAVGTFFGIDSLLQDENLTFNRMCADNPTSETTICKTARVHWRRTWLQKNHSRRPTRLHAGFV